MGKLAIVDSPDLIKLLASHPKSKGLLSEATRAFVERETGAIAGLERAVQAATAPSIGQQLLQDGYKGAIADGVSREEYSTNTERNGQEIAQKRVERAVLLPNGQAIQIQQAVQHVAVSQSQLGKRSMEDDLQLEERKIHLEERKIQNEKQRIENENHRAENKIKIFLRTSEALTNLDATWKDDKRFVLQMKEVLTNGILHDSVGNGNHATAIMPPSHMASISIGQVAMEMGVALQHGDSVKIGKLLRTLYQEKYGSLPDRHDQVVQGAVRKVNSYMEKDRNLMQSAIRLFK